MHDLVFLAGYWLLFWWKFLKNPYLLCTSEIASTYFPFWTWLGRRWQLTDDLYYKYPACIPFLSMWYPPNLLAAFIGRFLNEDLRFKFYVYFILGHYLLASFIAYKVFGLFGALTLTYAGYCIKPQTPSFVYTMCWIPGILLGGFWGGLSLGMALLGGYWPILVYVAPWAVLLKPEALWGCFLAIPQIVSFLWYWPRSVRANQEAEDGVGKIQWWQLKDLVWPTNLLRPTNGVHYPEVEMYLGISPFFIFHPSWWWLGALSALAICMGLVPSVQRIPARALYFLTFCVVSLSAPMAFSLGLSLVLIQAFLLLRNSSIYPSFPFSQWWRKPQDLYPEGDYTGYLNSVKKNDYRGAFSLK